MSYLTPSDLIARYGETDLRNLTDSSGQQVDADRLQLALDDAFAEIGSYLSSRYVWPLVDAAGQLLAAPQILRAYEAEIAVYRLQALRPVETLKDSKERYEKALAWLKSCANGEVALEQAKLRPDAASAGATPVGSAQFADSTSVFARGAW